MPRGKKKTENEKISAQAATKPTAQAAPTKKPRTTKAKATPTAAKSADKPVKNTTKKTVAPKAAAVPPDAKPAATAAKKNVRKSVNKVETPKVEATAKAASKSEKKTTSKKAAAPASKRTVRKSAKGTGDQVILQGNGEYTFAEITEMCKKAYRNGTKKQIKSIKIYVKAENNTLMAYYVVNETQNGSVKL